MGLVGCTPGVGGTLYPLLVEGLAALLGVSETLYSLLSVVLATLSDVTGPASSLGVGPRPS
jgi:hypothetical protein